MLLIRASVARQEVSGASGRTRLAGGEGYAAPVSSLSLRLVDRTACSPASYRVRERAPGEVDLVVLHQTATPPGVAESALDRTKAHALVLDSGSVLQLHGWLERLRFGSGPWNSRCVTIEHRANLPGRYHLGSPRWAGKVAREEWSAEGRRAQVLGARALLAIRAALGFARTSGYLACLGSCTKCSRGRMVVHRSKALSTAGSLAASFSNR